MPFTVEATPPPNCGEGGSKSDPFDLGDDVELIEKQVEQPPKRKRGSSQWMETAASALSDHAKGAKSSPKKNNEWEVFGRDVANSIRAINSVGLQRRVKFAIQSAIFQTTEQARPSVPQVPQPSTHASNPYICFNTFQENDPTYHTIPCSFAWKLIFTF